MQKTANRILSMLLTLVMVLSMLPAAVFAASETDVLEGWNLALGENIGVNFHLNSAVYTVTTTVNGVEVNPTISDKVVTVNVAAAQMTDTIGLTVKSGEETVHTGEYSVRQYAETILNGEYDAEVKEMVKEMLNYGAAAQTYFNYNLDSLANKDYALETAATVTDEVPAISAEGSVEGVSLYGMSLVFQSKTAVRFYFTGDVSGHVFKANGTALTPISKNSMYYVEVGNINPQDLDKVVTVTVDDTLSVSYSPLNYIVRKYNNAESSAELKALVQAMYGYHLEALEYQEYLEIIQVGTLQQHSNNTPWVLNDNETFFYFNTDAYTATTGEYTSLTADAIKLVRGGEVYSVANPGQGLLVKDNDTRHLLKLTPWGITGGHLPIQAHDYFIIEGRFESTSGDGTTIQIAKSYIYYDGTNVEVSETEPILPTTVEGGLMQTHSNSHADNGIYFTMDANDAPYNTDWTLEYTQTSVDNIKLIRDGVETSIGIVDRPLIIKYGETDYYLKLEGWNVGDYGWNGQSNPITTDDILIIEGDFKYAAENVTLNITKSYVYYDGSAWVCSAILPAVINGGLMQSHSNSHGDYGIYFSMDANDAPYSGWSYEYTQTSVDNIKLIRDGVETSIGIVDRPLIVKFGETDYYLKLEGWNVGDYGMNGQSTPITTDDILIIEGDFKYAAENVTLNITKSYVYYNGSAWVCSAYLPAVINGGLMQSHSNSHGDYGIYFSMDANDAPYSGWSYEYTQTSVDNIKLIRDGVETSIGIVDRPLIIKYGETDYYLKLEGWNVGDYGMNGQSSPITTDDILIIEGDFKYAAQNVTLNITKSYVYYDGAAWVCSAILPTTVAGGVMTEVSGFGWTGSTGDLIFKMDNTAPNGGYAPTSASNVKLIRDGVTYDVGYVGVDVINKDNDGWYTLAFWTIVDYKPMLANDILVVEGDFYQSSTKTTLNISKTYVLLNADSSAEFSTEMPIIPVTVAGGLMMEVSGFGWTGSTGDLIFKMDNTAPTGGYAPTSAGNIKLIRDGVTYDVGYVGVDVINKDNDGWYTLAFWTIVDYKPMLANDILVVEGDFYQSSTKTTLNISKTYVLLNEDSTAEFSTEMPVLDTTVDVVSLSSHSNGWSSTSAENPGGLYFTASENDAPYNTDWSLRYTPVSADVIKLIRDGVETNAANTGADTIIKYSATEYYLEFWPFSQKPMLAGDEIIIEGLFYNAANNTYINVEKTYLILNADNSVTVITGGYIDAGTLSDHSNGINGTDGIYATMAENAAPYDGWNIEYAPVTADAYSVIRDGETINIGIPGRGTLVKFSDTEYYLKLTQWCTDNFAFTNDDIFVISGLWKQNTGGSALMKIEKTYLYYDGSAWVFSTTKPEQKTIVDMVDLGSHAVNGWTSNGFYFVAPENDAPLNTDWSLRYTPVSADAIKLVHDGVETNVGNTGGETVIKYSTTEYYIEGWTVGMSSVVAGDQMIIEGLFYNAANDTYINIEKTYFTFNADGTVTVINDADKYIDAGTMGAYETGWFNNGFYFAMASNNLPYNAAQEDWSVEYAPTSTAAIKLIRDGVTTDSARVGAGTMIKLADGKYYMKIEGWTITSISSKDDLQVGDILVVEGDFVSESNGYTLHIDESYITIGEGSVSFSTGVNTDFGEVLLPNSADTLTIGMWNGSYHVFEDKQLQELQAAGITKIVGIDTQWIGTTDVNAWLDRVYSYGISVVFDLRGWDGVTVPSYASHPGVLGFLMWDEPSTADFATLADLKAKFDAIDAFNGKLFYVNLLASCVADSSLFGDSYSTSQTDYDTYYVTKFLDTLDIEVLSWDNYSLISQADDTTAKGIRTDYFYNFEVMASKASENMPLWYIMLSAGHNSGAENTIYNTPTAEELRWQMAVAMTYGVQNIDHYVYVSHADDYSSMVEYETWEPTALYYDIKTVDNEYLAWDNIFMAYDWVGVGKYSANSKDTMLDQLENCLTLSNYGISSISASENTLVGVFDCNGGKAYMVTNAGSTSTSWFSGDVGDGREFNMADSTVTLTLDAADYKCAAVINNGQITYVAVENNTVTLDVEAYEGVFVIPIFN